MAQPSRWARARRRSAAWASGWFLASLLYLLLIDTTDLPELIAGVGAAALAATGFELAREQDLAGLTARLAWLRRVHRPLLRAPADIVTVSWVAVRQLVRPRAVNGQFRSVPFRGGEDARLEVGKRALAQSLGSFAPNTIVIGVDAERELLLGHQLRCSGGDAAIDVMKLG